MHLLDRTNLLSEFPELGTPYRKHRFGSTAFTSNFTCRAVVSRRSFDEDGSLGEGGNIKPQTSPRLRPLILPFSFFLWKTPSHRKNLG